ncbi:hypothetical protein B7494_g5493 [Chlorociboria aeruginascens]|nr:hypothetical protein B7494_g5493 [Chlorociboria aeruginascens]
MATLEIELQNRIPSLEVYAYITGQALQNNNHVCLIQSDGRTPYYPDSPSQTITPLSTNCSIRLGVQGSITKVTIPQLAGGRIWFSLGSELKFFLNPGPALVEPSVTNPSDANIDINWGFCEFTFNSSQLYANISYVDFVSLPISLGLRTASGEEQKVLGLKPDGLETVCAGLEAQSKVDGAGWDQLVVQKNGQRVRALSPNNGMVGSRKLFDGYYDNYVNDVWAKYANSPLTIDTQAQWSKLEGRIENNELKFGGLGSFPKPSTGDIFSCSTGPFVNNAGALGPLTARISAGFNRSTLPSNNVHPNKEKVSQYYQHPFTNHYARLVHQANIDGRGYAFPYDDVAPIGDVDQSGFVNGSPKAFRVTIG